MKTLTDIFRLKQCVTSHRIHLFSLPCQKVEDEVEMVQEMDAVEDIEYDLVEDAEEDSDYKSDFDSEEEDSNDI